MGTMGATILITKLISIVSIFNSFYLRFTMLYKLLTALPSIKTSRFLFFLSQTNDFILGQLTLKSLSDWNTLDKIWEYSTNCSMGDFRFEGFICFVKIILFLINLNKKSKWVIEKLFSFYLELSSKTRTEKKWCSDK